MDPVDRRVATSAGAFNCQDAAQHERGRTALDRALGVAGFVGDQFVARVTVATVVVGMVGIGHQSPGQFVREIQIPDGAHDFD